MPHDPSQRTFTKACCAGVAVALAAVFSPSIYAEPEPQILTLEQAKEIGLANRPALKARQLFAATARQTTLQIESARYPLVSGNATAATAQRETTVQDGREVSLDTRIAAGALNNPTVLRRDAAGVIVSQLVTDFGRTSSLIQSSRFNEASQQQQVNATRAQVLADIADAYFAALEAQAVLQVAQKTLEARQTLLNRIAALTKSKLKSELDVRFAQVNLDESRLLLLRAQNAVDAAFSHLSTSVGSRDTRRYTLVDPPSSEAPPADLDALLMQAIAVRPELASLRADREAARKFVEAQKALRYPTINAFAAGGVTPIGDERFPRNYGAIGINLNINLFDGGKITALQQEARLRAFAVSENLTEAENTISNAVRIAWLNARAGYENIAISEHLRDAASQALKLAEARYNLGITSFVELNQAQLSAIDAEIGASRAKYQYLTARTVLDYQVGALNASAAGK
ncbi:MAG: TolC family protein [Betaproteobacteria bacterium]